MGGRDSLIVFNDAYLGRLIATEAGTHFNPECDVSIARVTNDTILGGVTLTNYTGASIGMHVAGFRPGWINNDLLWVCFDYPFVQLGCKKIFGLVPSTNSKALAFNKKLGFKIETTVPGVFDDGDMVVMSMAKEDCRWLKLKPRGFAKDAEG